MALISKIKSLQTKFDTTSVFIFGDFRKCALISRLPVAPRCVNSPGVLMSALIDVS